MDRLLQESSKASHPSARLSKASPPCCDPGPDQAGHVREWNGENVHAIEVARGQSDFTDYTVGGGESWTSPVCSVWSQEERLSHKAC
jgi:hypothetical protein